MARTTDDLSTTIIGLGGVLSAVGAGLAVVIGGLSSAPAGAIAGAIIGVFSGIWLQRRL